MRRIITSIVLLATIHMGYAQNLIAVNGKEGFRMPSETTVTCAGQPGACSFCQRGYYDEEESRYTQETITTSGSIYKEIRKRRIVGKLSFGGKGPVRCTYDNFSSWKREAVGYVTFVDFEIKNNNIYPDCDGVVDLKEHLTYSTNVTYTGKYVNTKGIVKIPNTVKETVMITVTGRFHNGTKTLNFLIRPRVSQLENVVSSSVCQNTGLIDLNHLFNLKGNQKWSGDYVSGDHKFDTNKSGIGIKQVVLDENIAGCIVRKTLILLVGASYDVSGISNRHVACDVSDNYIDLYAQFGIDKQDAFKYNWRLVNGSQSLGKDGKLYVGNISSGEAVHLKLEGSNANCKSSKSVLLIIYRKQQVTVDEVKPTCNAKAGKIYLPRIQGSSYVWSNLSGDKLQLGGNTFVVPVRQEDFTVQVQIKNSEGCLGFPKVITVPYIGIPNPNFGSASLEVCSATSVFELNKLTDVRGIWRIGGKIIKEGKLDVDAYDNRTVDALFEVNVGACSEIYQVRINFSKIKKIEAGEDMQVCSMGGRIDITPGSSKHDGIWYSEDPRLIDRLDKKGTLYVDGLEEGDFTVYYKEDIGCENIDSKIISITGAPTPINLNDVEICSLEVARFKYESGIPDGYTVAWYSNTNSDIPLATGEDVTLNLAGKATDQVFYSYKLLEGNTCTSERKSVRFKVVDNSSLLPDLPNRICSSNTSNGVIDLGEKFNTIPQSWWTGKGVIKKSLLDLKQLSVGSVLLTYHYLTRKGCEVSKEYRLKIGVDANFTISQKSVQINEPIALAATTEDGATVTWTIDGKNMEGHAVRHFFNKSGTFKVTASVMANDNSCKSEYFNIFEVTVMEQELRETEAATNETILSIANSSTVNQNIIQKVYPIPMKNELSFEVTKKGRYSLKLYSMKGNLITEGTFTFSSGAQFIDSNFSRLIPTGLSIIEVADGNNVQRFKIIK